VKRASFAACCALAASFASSASADDWLALYPECAFPSDARALGRMSVLYPRLGFPAVVEAGDRLVARVRVPSGLTPPPGMQQDRALHGWSAELVGQTGERIDGLENRYDLRVVDVRPDGGSSLVYRASILVPAWAAPGTYSLALSAPGGSETTTSSVRIIEVGATARLARADESIWSWSPTYTGPPSRKVDVFLVSSASDLEREHGRGDPPVALVVESEPPNIALRLGADRLLVLGECDTAAVRFGDAVSGIERREHRRPLSLVRALTATSGTQLLDGAPLEPGLEYTEVYPLDYAASFGDGVDVTFFPATAFHASTARPAIAARIRVRDSNIANRRLTRANLEAPSIVFEPAEPEAGPVRMRLSSSGFDLVAWQLDEDTTLVGPEITHSFATVGVHEIRALAIRPDGAAVLASAALEIHAQRAEGCEGCSAAQGTSVLPEVVLLAVVLLQTGRRRKYHTRSTSF
jgi:hypothetical protein